MVLETLEVEAEAEVEESTLDLEQSFEEPFIREKVFSDKIEAESIPDIKSALKEMPNVTVREQGAFTKQIQIRGFSGDRIISIVDGVRIANQGMTHTGGGEVNLIDISTVASIEVVKGAPAVVYDPGATGGIIQVETKKIDEEDHLKLKTTFGYDDGTEKTKQGTTLSGARSGFGAALSYSQTDADGYRVKDEAKLDAVIRRTNEQEERIGTPFEIEDLGFEDESLTLNLSYRFHPHHKLTFQSTDYEAADLSFTHGGFDSTVFHVDALTRKTHQARYQIEDLGLVEQFSLAYADQELVREVTVARSILESQSIHVSGVIPIKNTRLTMGGEFVDDQADTQVFSEQIYGAGYVSAESLHGDWTYLAGARANRWTSQAKLPEGRDASIVNDLVNVEGQFNPETGEFELLSKTAFTYATGVVYTVNENNNLSVNYSKTHRFPSLFERFAFGGFTGGGLGLKSEEADNFEAAWKFYDGLFFASFSIFYSDFDNYITVKQRTRITNLPALQTCIRQGRCDPLAGDFDGREGEFFASDFSFFNVKRVVNRGFEVSLKRVREEEYEAGLNFGLNDFDVRAVHDPTDKDVVITDANPLEFSFHIKRYFSVWISDPWIEIKGRYVTNTPDVDQIEGFSQFFVADLFAGFKYSLDNFSKLTFNAGIRNLGDEVHHEPYSALDGLKRSYF
ncbi:MAG: TonB-dependent receptor, partial [Nitrospiria bacterium]